MRIIRFVAKRLVYLVPQLFGISLLTFIVVRLLPGNPAYLLLGPAATEEGVAAMSARMGLDKPIWIQYAIYIKKVCTGDFGTSWFTSNSVLTDLLQRVPATLELITLALLLAVVVFIPLGRATALRGGSVVKKGVFAYGMTAGALPDFWLALILIYVFYYLLNLVPPPMGRLDLSVSAPAHVTGSYLIDSLLAWNWEAFKSALGHLILPVFTLTFVYGGPILKMTQMSVIKMMDEKFIKHARDMGVTEPLVHNYAMKNALPPIVTVIGMTYSYLLGGAVLVEFIFGWGGLGQYAVEAIRNSDYAPIQAFVLLAAFFNLAVYLVVDIIYFIINPRVEI